MNHEEAVVTRILDVDQPQEENLEAKLDVQRTGTNGTGTPMTLAGREAELGGTPMN